MDRTTLIDFFEDMETTEEYNGYFCSIAEAISIVVLGSLCGLKKQKQRKTMTGLKPKQLIPQAIEMAVWKRKVEKPELYRCR